MQCNYAPFLSLVYVLAIHSLLDGTLGGASAFSLSQLLVSAMAKLSKGGDCDVKEGDRPSRFEANALLPSTSL